jgi:FAD/FMN-containing dehydrogenase
MGRLRDNDLGTLRDRARGPVLVPGDEGYDAERSGFNTAVDQRPDVIVGATGADDVRAAVVLAAAAELPVGVSATGHGAAFGAAGGVLVTTRRMTGVSIDPAARRARLAAGVRWGEVIEAAARHGLAPLSGSASHVGAVGYTVGGGLPLLGRTFGYAADRVHAFDLVTADGRSRRVTADAEPDLFWAVRGGRDNFGVVTALETELVPLTRIWGGGLFLDAGGAARAAEILDGYLRWTATVPEEMNSSLALVPLPDVPALPEPLRGRHVAHVRVAWTGSEAAGERCVAPLRALGPRLLDHLADLPFTEADAVHDDPAVPMPWNGDVALLDDLDEAAARSVVEIAGPEAAVPCVVEVRHLGGALARPPAAPNAVGHRDARYSLGVLSRLGGPDDARALAAHRALLDALGPRLAGRLVNFMGHGTGPEGPASADRVRTAYRAADLRRLTALKAAHDPANTFRLNHNLPPAGG